MRDLESSLPFIQHLRVEHAHLNDAVRQARETVFAPRTDPPTVEAWQQAVAQQLLRLREQLAHHFAEEEHGGCLEEAACRCPSVAGDAALLEKEHPQLLARLDQLLGLARRDRDGIEAVEQIRARFTEFVQAFAAHEDREHGLVERGLGYAADDVDPTPSEAAAAGTACKIK